MRGSTVRKHDYDALQADWERGETLAAMVTRYRINRSVLQEIAARHQWKRPVRTDYTRLRQAYEEGMVLSRIAKEFRISAQRIAALAAEGRWKRPVATTEATHLAMQAEYEAGVSIDEIAEKHGYKARSIRSLAYTFGWHRTEVEEKRKDDPLAAALRRAGYAMHVAPASRPVSTGAPAWVR